MRAAFHRWIRDIAAVSLTGASVPAPAPRLVIRAIIAVLDRGKKTYAGKNECRAITQDDAISIAHSQTLPITPSSGHDCVLGFAIVDHRQTLRRTLLVDDDPSLLDALTRAFTEAGEEVAAYGNFEDARRALHTTVFHAMVTDVRLGEFNGLQLAVIARATNPGIRILVFSGFDDPVLRTEAEHVGAIYLVKPVAGSTLLQLLRDPDAIAPESGAL